MAKGTIREAMRLLEAQGLVKSRTGPGGGNFVHEVSRARAKALLGNYFYFKSLTIDDIYRLRPRPLEPDLAADLAGRLSAETLARLEANVRRIRQAGRYTRGGAGTACGLAEVFTRSLRSSRTTRCWGSSWISW